MSTEALAARSLDGHALEARTQALGRVLFAAVKREHAHLSILNRWTTQVLSWCLADPALKSSVLRFIDVLPSLRTPREIAQHVRESFPSGTRLPAALRLGTQLMHTGPATRATLAAVIRQLVEQVAQQFIAGHRPEDAMRVIQSLAHRGATCSLDILGEQVLSDAEAERYVAECQRLLGVCAAAYAALPATMQPRPCGPWINVSVKPSALTPRFDPISPTTSLARALHRILPLIQTASTHGALITLDMEQYELRDLTLLLAQELLVHPDAEGRAELGVVIQAYLRDAEAATDTLLRWLAAHEHALTIRLVKGAYWDSELAQAAQAGWPAPVYQDKAETDLAFERLTRRLLGASPLVRVAIASHNVRSIAHAMALAELLGLGRDQLEFQLLYGMGEALQSAIVSMGYPVRVYTPIGELLPGMAYLVRRILENTANESFLRQEVFQERPVEELLQPPTVASGEPARALVTVPEEEPPWPVEPLHDFARAEARESLAAALTRVRALTQQHHPLRLGDRAVDTEARTEAHNPAHPSERLGTVASASAAHIADAVRLARAAQPSWARRPARERIVCLRRAAQLFRRHRDELTAWEIVEAGKTWREADADVVEAIEYLEYYSAWMERLARGRPLRQLPGERNRYHYVPRGVAAVIAPWNFPAAILTGMTSAALVAGNAVLMKPAERASVIAAHLAALLREAGVPPDVLHFVPGRGETVGAALVGHPDISTVLFTGSNAVGLSILQACGTMRPGQRMVKHVIAEMGGKNAIIVDADADLDAAIVGVLRSAFGYGGQKCSAASRLFVHEAAYARFLARLIAATDRLVVGDPADPATDVGPLIEAAAQRRLQEAIARAADVGRVAYTTPAARLPKDGYFVGPTIVTDVPHADPLAQEELFGPLLCVFRVRTFEEALTLANDTAYALTGGVYSRSPSHLAQASDGFDVGNLYLNRPITGAMVGRQPFGGHRLSGLGTKAGGPDYLLHVLLPKTICTNTARHGVPLE